MKSSETKSSSTSQLYEFYRLFVLLSSEFKEDFIKDYHTKKNPLDIISKVIMRDVEEIDNKIFELLENLDAFETIQGDTISQEYSNQYFPSGLRN